MAEELVLWSTSELGLVRLADHHTTSSSIMPQKRNPDGAELIRGHAGLVFGHLQAMLTLTKGLPLAYNRDTQQERTPVVESVLATRTAAKLMAAMWRDLEVRGDRFEAELRGDLCLATELADLLVSRGVPFREAHRAVAEAVRWCQGQGGNLTLLDGGTARRFHREFPDDLSAWLDPRAAVERRTSRGGTAPREIERQLESLRRKLAELRP
jgi:argininosuccinate lyase